MKEEKDTKTPSLTRRQLQDMTRERDRIWAYPSQKRSVRFPTEGVCSTYYEDSF